MSDSVAHRVKTILDSDYIEGMSDGQAAEFDTPQKLMDRVWWTLSWSGRGEYNNIRAYGFSRNVIICMHILPAIDIHSQLSAGYRPNPHIRGLHGDKVKIQREDTQQ